MQSLDAVVLDLPPIDTVPALTDNLIRWYTGASLTNVMRPDSTYYISKSFQLVILDVKNWFQDRTFQAEFTNKFGDQSRARTKIFQLSVTGTV